ncbi:hypothetical protein [Pseudomonas taiwanensis]|uniref:hypothetical protein n=1 Tax=Pseudomonas taiwanensis TaxID=470150 RepID=UPI0016485825|nr:hypothetical protein [Pseudomonas taiwanensis]MBC3490455.1 hypothetical protein [Pseudomonas taiwanensis]
MPFHFNNGDRSELDGYDAKYGLDVWPWMAPQRAQGREVIVLLDGEAFTRRELMAALGSDRWCALHSQTPAG